MGKLLKILPLLLAFVFLANISVVCASGIDMDLEANEAGDDTVYGSSQNVASTTNTTTTTTNEASHTQIPVGTTAALSSSSLELPTIVNIILIVIGILLILLGIAILIRMH